MAPLAKIKADAAFYFDHNATTPVAPEALETMVSCLGQVYGNASSIHYFGQLAKQRLEAARRQAGRFVGLRAAGACFTSGGTEAEQPRDSGRPRAALRSGPRHVITSAVEHPAVLGPVRATGARRRGSNSRRQWTAIGVVDPGDVRRALRRETRLISIMHANNELGTVQPMREIAAIAREAGVLLHVDGVQALGKLPVNVDELGADLYSVSAHKIYAPKGVGALYVAQGHEAGGGRFRRPSRARTAAGHGECSGDRGLRRGGGFGGGELSKARTHAWLRCATAWNRRFSTASPHKRVNGGGAPRAATPTNIQFDGIDGEAMVIALDLRGFAVSTGSACSSGAIAPSHVLTAIGLSTRTPPAPAFVFRWAHPIPRSKWMDWWMRSKRPPRICAAFRCMPDAETLPIAVAMSGGVDSSTVAALLVRQGRAWLG